MVQPSNRKTVPGSTKGWQLCVQWKGGRTNWVSLAELKDSNPLELAKYAKAHGLLHESAFNWWAKDVLRLYKSIISKVKS
jgi:hypothetical protein